MPKIFSCLCFENDAEEAVRFYTTVFEHYKTKQVAYYGPHTAESLGRVAGAIFSVDFEIEDHHFIALNGPQYPSSSAISFFVSCESQEEIDLLWQRLSDQGSILMALDKYPWSPRYGWCTDRFGISWQLMMDHLPQKISPSFLFVNKLFGKGEEAINFYTSIFPASKVDSIHRDPKDNTIMFATFLLNGQNFILMESSEDQHEQFMSPAISLVINCKDQEEIDYYWSKLSEGGKVDRCGWLVDKFGVSWQVVPEFLSMMVSGSDQLHADMVMSSIMHMKKLNIDELRNSQ